MKTRTESSATGTKSWSKLSRAGRKRRHDRQKRGLQFPLKVCVDQRWEKLGFRHLNQRYFATESVVEGGQGGHK